MKAHRRGARLARPAASLALAALASLGLLMGCGEPETARASAGGGQLPWDLPLGFPMPSIPEDNQLTAEKFELGRHLFYEKRLSGNGEQACGTCHEQRLAFTDGKKVAVGSTGEHHPRNSQSLTNVAYNSSLTWANPALTELERQILIPLFGDAPVELGAGGRADEILMELAADPLYQALFTAAYGSGVGAGNDPELISWGNIVGALASFVRGLISGGSAFDRFTYHREFDALSPSARRGLDLFFSERLECHHCHGGFNFTEASIHADTKFDVGLFHNTGLYNLDGEGAYPGDNMGMYEITGEPSDMGRFRAPTLRNIALTAPYMHDGSVSSLEEVIRLYEAGGRLIEAGPLAGDGRANPFKSGFVAGFRLSDSERQDLIAFLNSLTDREFITNPRFSDPFAEAEP